MPAWKIAAVQMDCRLGQPGCNLGVMRDRLSQAAAAEARLVVFPECALSGYAFDSLEEAWPHAEAVPGPATARLAEDCRRLGTWAAFGLLERASGGRLFNACALIGPDGLRALYRKLHLPFLGVDRFTTPGDLPLAVYDLGGLRIGINICYDGSFPEPGRVLAVLGADLIVLPTNWPPRAVTTARFLVPTRALENHIYYAAVNRVGEEGGFRFIGHSRVVDYAGETIAAAGADVEEILYAEIEPERAREKREVFIPGRYEIDRMAHRRPEMYGPICAPCPKP